VIAAISTNTDSKKITFTDGLVGGAILAAGRVHGARTEKPEEK
jgi:hypothetical protein